MHQHPPQNELVDQPMRISWFQLGPFHQRVDLYRLYCESENPSCCRVDGQASTQLGAVHQQTGAVKTQS